MITSIQNRATIGRVMAFGDLVARLLMAMVLSAAPTGAAVPSSKAFGWGTNDYGEPGNGTNDYSNLPVTVRDLSGVKSVKAGDGHGLALLQNGTVWAWGYGGSGELVNGIFDNSAVPVKVRIGNVKAIAVGYSHSLALKEDGSVWAWGYNNYGRLGNGASGANAYSDVPVAVKNLMNVKNIDGRNGFTLAATQ